MAIRKRIIHRPKANREPLFVPVTIYLDEQQAGMIDGWIEKDKDGTRESFVMGATICGIADRQLEEEAERLEKLSEAGE